MMAGFAQDELRRCADRFLQLNVRVPSMLILRDRLKNNPHSVPVDLAVLLGGKGAGGASHPSIPDMPIPGSAVPPTRGGLPAMANMFLPGEATSGTLSVKGKSAEASAQQAAIRKKMLQRQTAELVTNAVENAGKVDDWTVKQWLQL